MSETLKCKRCGAPLIEEAVGGLCPRCLMALNFETRTVVEGAENPGAVPPLSPEEMAARFPQYEVLEYLGRGGMGIVYKARQKTLDRVVAIKVLAGEWQGDAGFAARFEREAKTLAQMSHPNIVTVHDFGEADGLYFIVMEYVDGVNLRDLLLEGRMEPEQALAVVPPVCEALEYAHGKCVVHRDIKPENLLLDREGRVKIADFGIASLVGAEMERSGTPAYMAPEQKSGNADRRADIYALGVVLYEMLTGERPAEDFVAPSRKVQVDVKIDEMVLRALENEPERRYQTAEEFRTVVETIDPARGENVSAQASAASSALPFLGFFRSSVARWFARIGWVLGCLGFLGFLGDIPELSKWKALFGMFGFFGLVGVGALIEMFVRARSVAGKVFLGVFGAVTFLIAANFGYLLLSIRSGPQLPGTRLTAVDLPRVSRMSSDHRPGIQYLDLDEKKSVTEIKIPSLRDDRTGMLNESGADLLVDLPSQMTSWSFVTPNDKPILLAKIPVRYWQDPGALFDPAGVPDAHEFYPPPEDYEVIQVEGGVMAFRRMPGMKVFNNEMGTEVIEIPQRRAPADPESNVFFFQTAEGTQGLLRVSGIVFDGDERDGVTLEFIVFNDRFIAEMSAGTPESYRAWVEDQDWTQPSLYTDQGGYAPGGRGVHVKCVQVDKTGIRLTPSDFEEILDTKDLDSLVLKDSSVNDEDLAELAHLDSVISLDLSATRLGTAHKPQVTDAGLEHLARWKSLKKLRLYGLPITDDGIRQLVHLPELRALQLGGTLVRGQGLRSFRSLTWLRMDATPVTDHDLKHLAGLENLEQLYLDYTSVSDEGIRHLEGMKRLRAINLHGTRVTDKGVSRLKHRMPGIIIWWDEIPRDDHTGEDGDNDVQAVKELGLNTQVFKGRGVDGDPFVGEWLMRIPEGMEKHRLEIQMLMVEGDRIRSRVEWGDGIELSETVRGDEGGRIRVEVTRRKAEDGRTGLGWEVHAGVGSAAAWMPVVASDLFRPVAGTRLTTDNYLPLLWIPGRKPGVSPEMLLVGKILAPGQEGGEFRFRRVDPTWRLAAQPIIGMEGLRLKDHDRDPAQAPLRIRLLESGRFAFDGEEWRQDQLVEALGDRGTRVVLVAEKEMPMMTIMEWINALKELGFEVSFAVAADEE